MTVPFFKMMVGLPGSGKSSQCKEIPSNTVVLSSDEYRLKLFGTYNANTKEYNNKVFTELRNDSINYIKEGTNVIYDATNLTRKYRKALLSQLPTWCTKYCDIIWATPEQCIKRNIKRERTVGKDVIFNMLKSFQVPMFYEGFNYISVVGNDYLYWEREYQRIIEQSCKISQHNPHHRFTVYDHCQEAYLKAKDITDNDVILNATMFHDIGKPLTKQFMDYSGNDTDIAHYYNHNNVGAYLALGMPYNMNYTSFDNLFTAWLIENHMMHYNPKSIYEKWVSKIPTWVQKSLDIVHLADQLAH